MSVECMGGWCTLRDVCRHHQSDRRVVVERLCEPGTLAAFSPTRDITFIRQVDAPRRANSVFDLARAQQEAA